MANETLQTEDFDCLYCVYYGKCGVEEWKNHAYNLRDGTEDCFVPRDDIIVPPWFDPRTECYRCMRHSANNCDKCNSQMAKEWLKQINTEKDGVTNGE